MSNKLEVAPNSNGGSLHPYYTHTRHHAPFVDMLKSLDDTSAWKNSDIGLGTKVIELRSTGVPEVRNDDKHRHPAEVSQSGNVTAFEEKKNTAIEFLHTVIRWTSHKIKHIIYLWL